MYKAVFFDIDGTLISKKTFQIPDSVSLALKKLKEKGIYTGIATGRHTLEIEEGNLLKDLEFDFYVTLTGQICYDHQKLVHTQALDPKDIQKAIDISNQYDIPLAFVEEKRIYINKVNDHLIAAHQSIHTPLPPIAIYQNQQPLYQMCSFHLPTELHLFNGLEHTTITQWHDGAYDLIPNSGSKATGIQKVLKPYGITLDEVICFGDGDNDCDMLEKCGLGVALKDSSDNAKKAANEITLAVDEDGIYHTLKKHHIID